MNVFRTLPLIFSSPSSSSHPRPSPLPLHNRIEIPKLMIDFEMWGVDLRYLGVSSEDTSDG